MHGGRYFDDTTNGVAFSIMWAVIVTIAIPMDYEFSIFSKYYKDNTMNKVHDRRKIENEQLNQ